MLIFLWPSIIRSRSILAKSYLTSVFDQFQTFKSHFGKNGSFSSLWLFFTWWSEKEDLSKKENRSQFSFHLHILMGKFKQSWINWIILNPLEKRPGTFFFPIKIVFNNFNHIKWFNNNHWYLHNLSNEEECIIYVRTYLRLKSISNFLSGIALFTLQ